MTSLGQGVKTLLILFLAVYPTGNAILTAVFKKQSRTALGILGDISIGGGIQKVNKFSDKVAMLSENGARSILAPIGNTPEMANIPQSLLTKTDILFYSDSQQLLQKAVTEG